MTLSSAHSSALPLYVRYGMLPRFPVLYVSGAPLALPDDFAVRTVTADQAAQAEQALTGIDRDSDYQYWAARPTCTLLRRWTWTRQLLLWVQWVAMAFHMASRTCPWREQWTPRERRQAAAAQLAHRAYVCVPGPNPALSALLERSWRIIDSDQFMSTRAHVIDPQRLLPHSGLM